MKGQSSLEYTIIFSVGVFLSLIFFVISLNNMNNMTKEKESFEVKRILDEWYVIAYDIWLQGKDAKYEWRGNLPVGYDAATSRIEGNSIIIVVNGIEYSKPFYDFTITGNMPNDNKDVKMEISFNGNEIVFNPK